MLFGSDYTAFYHGYTFSGSVTQSMDQVRESYRVMSADFVCDFCFCSVKLGVAITTTPTSPFRNQTRFARAHRAGVVVSCPHPPTVGSRSIRVLSSRIL
jgi:hypothetical protein